MARKQLTRKGPTFPNRAPRVEHLKPPKFAHYLTLGELARKVGKDKDWLRKLEREGRIPEGIRHKIGKLEIRLYPPERVREIQSILAGLKPGRPRKEG